MVYCLWDFVIILFWHYVWDFGIVDCHTYWSNFSKSVSVRVIFILRVNLVLFLVRCFSEVVSFEPKIFLVIFQTDFVMENELCVLIYFFQKHFFLAFVVMNAFALFNLKILGLLNLCKATWHHPSCIKAGW